MTKPPFSLNDFHNAIREGKYRVQYHARKRRRERGFSHDEMIDILLTGDVIESYSTAMPDPKCLMMKRIAGEPTYVVVAFDENTNYAYIITIHGYDPDKWVDPWTRRTP